MADCVLSVAKHDSKEVFCKLIDYRMYTCLVLLERFPELRIILLPENLLDLFNECLCLCRLFLLLRQLLLLL